MPGVKQLSRVGGQMDTMFRDLYLIETDSINWKSFKFVIARRGTFSRTCISILTFVTNVKITCLSEKEKERLI